MRDLILPFSTLPVLAAMTSDDLNFWERVLEKWGIGLVGMALFCALAWWTAKREKALQDRRDAKEAEDRQERIRLAEENNRLNGLILANQEKHNARMEQLIKDQTKATQDHALEMRNLVRKMKRPCVGAGEDE